MSAEDHAYVAKHHEIITAWFAEAMATVVDQKPDDPISFLRHHLGEHDELRSTRLDELQLILEAERNERQRLEERLSRLEHMRELRQEQQPVAERALGELRLNLPSIASASHDLAEAGHP